MLSGARGVPSRLEWAICVIGRAIIDKGEGKYWNGVSLYFDYKKVSYLARHMEKEKIV